MKTHKIYLNVYNFMSGNTCLEAIGLGAYHTGIEIEYLLPPLSTTEYCYSVVSTDPNETGVIEIDPESAGYIFSRKIFIGEATLMNYRLEQIIE